MIESFQVIRAVGPANPDDRGNDQGVILINGQLTTNLPAELLIQIGKQMQGMGMQIMNDRNPEKQVMDQAILRRAGAPIGLSDNKVVQIEAAKESQWNRDLRRYQKPGVEPIKSTEVFGTPTIKGKA